MLENPFATITEKLSMNCIRITISFYRMLATVYGIILRKSVKIIRHGTQWKPNTAVDCWKAVGRPNLSHLLRLFSTCLWWFDTWREQTIVCAFEQLQPWIAKEQAVLLMQIGTCCKILTNWEIEITDFFQNRATSSFFKGMSSKNQLLEWMVFNMPKLEYFGATYHMDLWFPVQYLKEPFLLSCE